MFHHRSIPLCIILTIITCGLYGLYWMAVLNDDVNEVTESAGTSGGVAVLLAIVTCGIYGIYWAYTMGDKLDNARQRSGAASGSFPIIFLLLHLFGFGIITYALIQNELNKYTPA